MDSGRGHRDGFRRGHGGGFREGHGGGFREGTQGQGGWVGLGKEQGQFISSLTDHPPVG